MKGKRKKNEMGKKRKRRKKEWEKEREGENEKNGTKSEPPSPDAFPSTKLGNNITPIKGRLGKNTTPTGRGPMELNQNLQADPLRRRLSLDASFHADSSYAPEGAEYSRYGLHGKGVVIYKKAKALEKSRNHFKFSINQH